MLTPVTGVHDLDAYLQWQLLRAVRPHLSIPSNDQAFTLSLTLLAPHGTAVFKIFLSPLDPQGDMIRSQFAPFFEVPRPASTADPSHRAQPGFDQLDRRGGVWVRKPRSSRAGSGGACASSHLKSVAEE